MGKINPLHNALLFEELESRLLFSADVVEAVAAEAIERDFDDQPAVNVDLETVAEASNAAADPADEDQSVVVAEAEAAMPEPAVDRVDVVDMVDMVDSGDTDDTDETDETDGTAETVEPVDAAATISEVVFINDNVHEYQELVDGLQQGTGDQEDTRVVVLDDAESGIDQVTETLRDYRDLDAIHFITLGSDGALALGSDVLDRAGLLADSEAVFSWGDALGQDGDILLYGCNVAAGEDGRAFTDTLARLTDSDVAASDDKSGSLTLGGDWQLEYSAGDVETGLALGEGVMQEWQGVLDNAAPVLSVPGGPLDYSAGDPATVIAPAATVIDVDSADFHLGSLTVSFSAGGSADDQLVILEGGNVSLLSKNIKVDQWLVGSFSGGVDGAALVISWSPQATPENAEAVLRQIAFSNSSAEPSPAPRTVDFVLTDGDGGTSDLAQLTIEIAAGNDVPVVAVNDPLILEQGASQTITSDQLQVTDSDNTAAEVTFTLTAAPAGGTLELAGVALGLSDTFTQADIDAGLLSYVHGGLDTAADGFTFTVADGAGGIVGPTTYSITITAGAPVNVAPVLTVGSTQVDYTEGDPAIIIAPAATVTDVDSADFHQGSLTVSFSAGGSADDQLVIAEGNDVTLLGQNIKVDQWLVGSFSGGVDGAALVISWSPQATPENAEAVLRQIAFSNSSAEPSPAPRTVDFVLTDGDGGTSDLAQLTIDVTVVADPPVAADPPDTGIAPPVVVDPPDEVADPPDDVVVPPDVVADPADEVADPPDVVVNPPTDEVDPPVVVDSPVLADSPVVDNSPGEDPEQVDGTDGGPVEAGGDVMELVQGVEDVPVGDVTTPDEPPVEMERKEDGQSSTPAKQPVAFTVAANEMNGIEFENDAGVLDAIRSAAQSALDFIAPSAVASPYYPESTISSAPDTGNEVIRQQIEIMREEMDQAFVQSDNAKKLMVYSTTGASLSITAGFVSYLLRSGSLLTSFMATIPLWKGFDPVAILSNADHQGIQMQNQGRNLPGSVAADQKAETMFAGQEEK